MCRSLSVLTGLLLALGLLNLPASAATLTVPAQYSTIQAAVNAAVNGDTVLIADGTYTGPGNVDIDFGGRNITVSSVNGAAKTIIDCGGSSSGNHRGFYLSNGETNAIIKGLTVQNGYENGNSEAAIEGAGIYDYNAGLTIQNSTLKNNTCAYGGGIYIHNVDVGKATVMNCLLSGNSASYGGGVYGYNEASGTITATGCTLTGNSGATSGGGFYNINNTGGIITIFGCFLSSNSAPNAPTNGISGGGGIFNGNNGGTVTIADCALTGNSTLAWGGGLNSSNTSGTTTVISCTFTTNKAALSSGGGVYISGGINLTDDIIYGDTNGEVTAGYPSVSYSDIKGGYSGTSNINADPLFTLSPTDLHLLNGSPCIGMGTANSAPTVTLDGRTRPNPPSIGAYEADPRLQTTVTLSSSLNPSNPGQSVTFTAGVAGGGVKATGTAAFTVDGTTQATVPLTGNGTAAYTTSALSAGAHLIQAIYSGDGNLTPSKSAVLTQTNGLAGTAITVSSSLNPAVTGQYVNFQATLTNSGSSAASKPTGTVTFTVDGTVQQTTGLLSGRTAYYTTSSLPVSSHSVTAAYNGDASFAASVSSALTQTILQHVSPQYVSPSGNDSNLGTQAAPKLTIQAAINATLNGDTVIVEDGTYTGPGNVDLDFGGANLAVNSQNGPLKTIIDCGGSSANSRGFYLHYGETQAVISGFTIQNGNANGGAGIYNACRGLTVQNCIIKNNVSGYGSGGGIYNSGVLSLIGCTLSGNMANDGNYGSGGGGLSNDSGYLTLLNCTFIGNTAVGGGGGILNVTSSAGSLAMTNCVVINNSSSGSYGGGLYNSAYYGANTVTNCTFTTNSSYYSYTGSGLTSYVSGNATLTLTNDILYGDNGSEIGTYLAASVSHCNIQGYPYGTGHVDADPLFFSAVDLHLQNGSPCIGAGTAYSAPQTTIDGRTRPSPPSIGAYEAGITGTATVAVILASNLNPSVFGQSVTFTATVTAGGGQPSGTVTFFVDGTAQSRAALNQGKAAYSTTSLPGGSHSVIAAYSGDASFAPGRSAALTQIVNMAPTKTTLTSAPNPSSYGQQVIFTATVSGSSPAGTITFTDNTSGTTLGSGTLTSGATTFATSSLTGGTHQIVAAYSGDINNSPSSSQLSQAVSKGTTTSYLTSSVNPSLSTQSVTFTENVSGTGGTPIGTVTFTIDGTIQAPVALGGYASNAFAAYTTSSLSVGSHTITAAYNGDVNFTASASSALTQIVNPHNSPQYVSPSGSDSNLGTQAAPKLTIQAAINATLNGDTVIVEDGTYTGPGDVDLNPGGRNIMVTSQHGPVTTIIDCQGGSNDNHCGFRIANGETSVIISGFTVQNGYEGGGGFGGYGGAIYDYDSGLTVQDCIIKNNKAAGTSAGGSGGGIYLYNEGGSQIAVIDCTFSGNSATFGGGLIASTNFAPIAVINCTFTGNTANIGYGGGVYSANNGYPSGSGVVTLTNDILYGDTGGEITGANATATYCDIQGGYAGTGNINSDPLFVSSPPDLHLQAGSPCLGAGTDSSTPTTTLDGQARPDPPSMGAYEILPAAQPSLINDTDSGLIYNGAGWFYSAGRGFGDVNADVHATRNNGDFVSYSFVGSKLSIITETNSDEGTVDVYVDGAFKTTVNCNAAARQVKQTIYSVSGLAQGTHTLKLVKTGGSYMLLDALLATPAPSAGSTVNDNGSGIAYLGGGWVYYPNRGTGDFADDLHATTVNGDSYSYTFTGTSISYIAEMNFDEGNVQISLDGSLQAIVNAYSPTRLAQQILWSKSGLVNGTHTLKAVKQDGQYMLLDALQVAPALPPSTLVNDNSSGITYSGASWAYYPGRGVGDYGNDVHAATSDGDSVSYSFTGTSVSYITETDYDEGNVLVSIDGGPGQSISCYATGRYAQQSVYGVSGLAPGTHTIKLVKMGGQYMLLDAFNSQ